MNDYVIYTDSGCDIRSELLKEWGVKYSLLTFQFESENKEYSNEDMGIDVFYNRMKVGDVARTSAINPDSFSSAFEKILKTGKDILYLGFSSGLSTTYNSARIAAEELLADFPDRKIITVDTLSASAGQGLMIYLVSEKKKAGATIEEAAAYAEEIRPKLCHWFTPESLTYLKRGGRVSPTVAFVGTVLGIKPILHVDNIGKLVNVTKVRGRKASLNALVEKYGELAEDKKNGTVFISRADCPDDANYIEAQLKEKYGADVQVITDIGPVIGAHAGPGTIALFFVGKER